MGKLIEEAIRNNREGRMNLGFPFLIDQLCKQAEVQVSNQEELLHQIKVLVVRKKVGVPQIQGIMDSGNDSTSEEDDEEDA